MNIIIQQAEIHEITSPCHGQRKDVLIADGIIKELGDNLDAEDARFINGNDLMVSPGWIDMKSDFCDPGFEHKETVESGLDAAAAGGFTHVAVLPVNQPVNDHKSGVEYLLQKNGNHATQLHAIGSITQKREGKQLAELFDMHQSGVRLFSDDTHPLDAGILYRALLYCQTFQGIVVSFPREPEIAQNGQINEGHASVRTGLKAESYLSEVLRIQRDLRILEHTGGLLHITGISTAEGLDFIRQAKRKGLNVTCDVHVMNLLFSDEKLLDFNSCFKVLPPLRGHSDRKALWNGLLDGTIDAISTDHRPSDQEDKELEFDHASFGTIQLQTAFHALFEDEHFDLSSVIRAFTDGPQRILGISPRKITTGAKADITIVDRKYSWEYNRQSNVSKSFFSPFMNKVFTTKVVGIINNGIFVEKQSF
jgi:dihydroorotase